MDLNFLPRCPAESDLILCRRMRKGGSALEPDRILINLTPDSVLYELRSIHFNHVHCSSDAINVFAYFLTSVVYVTKASSIDFWYRYLHMQSMYLRCTGWFVNWSR